MRRVLLTDYDDEDDEEEGHPAVDRPVRLDEQRPVHYSSY